MTAVQRCVVCGQWLAAPRPDPAPTCPPCRRSGARPDPRAWLWKDMT